MAFDETVIDDYRAGRCAIWCDGIDEIMRFYDIAVELGLKLPPNFYDGLNERTRKYKGYADVLRRVEKNLAEYATNGMSFQAPKDKRSGGWMGYKGWYIKKGYVSYEIDFADVVDPEIELDLSDVKIETLF